VLRLEGLQLGRIQRDPVLLENAPSPPQQPPGKRLERRPPTSGLDHGNDQVRLAVRCGRQITDIARSLTVSRGNGIAVSHRLLSDKVVAQLPVPIGVDFRSQLSVETLPLSSASLSPGSRTELFPSLLLLFQCQLLHRFRNNPVVPTALLLPALIVVDPLGVPHSLPPQLGVGPPRKELSAHDCIGFGLLSSDPGLLGGLVIGFGVCFFL